MEGHMPRKTVPRGHWSLIASEAETRYSPRKSNIPPEPATPVGESELRAMLAYTRARLDTIEKLELESNRRLRRLDQKFAKLEYLIELLVGGPRVQRRSEIPPPPPPRPHGSPGPQGPN